MTASPMKPKNGNPLTLTAKGSLVDRVVKPLYNYCLDTKEHGMGHWLFGEFRVGRLFHCNDYIKQSTRTARMLSNGRIFYFGKNEVIHAIAH